MQKTPAQPKRVFQETMSSPLACCVVRVHWVHAALKLKACSGTWHMLSHACPSRSHLWWSFGAHLLGVVVPAVWPHSESDHFVLAQAVWFVVLVPSKPQSHDFQAGVTFPSGSGIPLGLRHANLCSLVDTRAVESGMRSVMVYLICS